MQFNLAVWGEHFKRFAALTFNPLTLKLKRNLLYLQVYLYTETEVDGTSRQRRITSLIEINENSK